jgi:chaperonin GroEL (HSP60 family)
MPVVTMQTWCMLTSLAVMATQAIANIVKSSFGPSGLDKMMVDDIGVRCPDRR